MRVGVDLGGTKIEAAAFDNDCRELARRRITTPRGDYSATISSITELVGSIESNLGCGAARVGIGIPGTVFPSPGLVKNANSTWLIGQPLDRDLVAALGRPVRLELTILIASRYLKPWTAPVPRCIAFLGLF